MDLVNSLPITAPAAAPPTVPSGPPNSTWPATPPATAPAAVPSWLWVGALAQPPNANADAIVVTAGAAALEPALIDQLAPGGTLVAPVAGQLLRLRKDAEGGIEQINLAPVSFVPLLAGVVE